MKRRPALRLDDAERARLAAWVRRRRAIAGGDESRAARLRRLAVDAIGDGLAIESPALAAAVAWFERRLAVDA